MSRKQANFVILTHRKMRWGFAPDSRSSCWRRDSKPRPSSWRR